VEALAVQLTQREGELIQEKAEVKKLANFLKQVILSLKEFGIFFSSQQMPSNKFSILSFFNLRYQ
jgi:hypothetical protein